MTAPRTRLKEWDDPILGRVRWCNICLEEWPADREFFYSTGLGGRRLHSRCRACYGEWRQGRRREEREARRSALVATA